MRNMILVACILSCVATVSYAQIEKRTVIGGINGNFSYMSQHGRKATTFGLNVYSLYALEKNIAVGLVLDNTFSSIRSKMVNGESAKYTSYNLLVTPEIRKYFGSGSLLPYVGLSTGVSYNYLNADYPGFDALTNVDFYLAPVAGFSWWLNDKVFLDLQAKYGLVNQRQSGDPLNISIGVGFKLGR